LFGVTITPAAFLEALRTRSDFNLILCTQQDIEDSICQQGIGFSFCMEQG
jgi:hypothetical protein